MEPFPRHEALALVRRVPSYGLLAWRLGRDPTLAPSRRGALIGAAAYLASPIDAVPGIIPVLGQLDDLLVLVVALRFALSGMTPPQREIHLVAAGLSEETIAADEQALRDIGRWAIVSAAIAAREVSRASLRAGARATRGVAAAGRSSWGAVSRAARRRLEKGEEALEAEPAPDDDATP
jgi:uncharacterized membrane protein YkvA (DUF1232 family)